MKVLFGMLFLTLIAGTSCQVEPTMEQIQCFIDFIVQNHGGTVEVCGNIFNESPNAFCENEDCMNALDTIYRGCGYTRLELCEF